MLGELRVKLSHSEDLFALFGLHDVETDCCRNKILNVNNFFVNFQETSLDARDILQSVNVKLNHIVAAPDSFEQKFEFRSRFQLVL